MFKDKEIKISSKNGSVAQVELSLNKDVKLPFNGAYINILVKRNDTDENVGIAWHAYFDKEKYYKIDINLDWSKIKNGDTLRLFHLSVPGWSRLYNSATLKRYKEGTLLPPPKYVYMGDNAKLFGKPVTYGLNKDDINVYLEDQTLPVTYTLTGWSMVFAIYYQNVFQSLCISEDPAPAAYGVTTIYDIQGDLWIAYALSNSGKEVAKAVLNTNGRLESFYISEEYYTEKVTNIKPVYYTDTNYPAVFIDNNAYSKTGLQCTVDNIVQKDGATSINVNEIYTLEAQSFQAKIKLLSSDDTLLGESNQFTVPTSEHDAPSVSISLDDDARAKIKAETGHLKVTYEKVG